MAFSLNRMDVSQRKGLYPAPQDASEILGVEFAGHVTALGPDTSATWAIGDQVLGLASGVSQHRRRTYTYGVAKLQLACLGRLCRIYCCAGNADPPQTAATFLGGGCEHSRGFHHRRVPNSVLPSWPHILSLLGLTAERAHGKLAFQALILVGDIKHGDDVLVHAAASGVGIATIQLARFYGA